MATLTLRPDAAGDLTEWQTQFPAATFHWDKVDEAGADDDTTYIIDDRETADMEYDLFNLPASGVSAGTILSVTVYFRAERSGWGSVGAVLKTGGTRSSVDMLSAGGAADGAYVNFNYEWTVNPTTTDPWTWAEIDALQIGVASWAGGGQWVKCTQVYVVVDYIVSQAVGEGAVGIAGTLGRKTSKIVGEGAVGIAGTLVGILTFVQAVGGGAVGIAAQLAIKVKKAVGDGAISIAGTLGRLTKRTVGDGAISIAGTLTPKTKLTVGAGAVAIIGTLVRLPKIGVGSGAVAMAGTLTSIKRMLQAVGGGSVGIVGRLSWRIKRLRGLFGFTGRDLSDVEHRDLSDDNDEFRDLTCEK